LTLSDKLSDDNLVPRQVIDLSGDTVTGFHVANFPKNQPDMPDKVG